MGNPVCSSVRFLLAGEWYAVFETTPECPPWDVDRKQKPFLQATLTSFKQAVEHVRFGEFPFHRSRCIAPQKSMAVLFSLIDYAVSTAQLEKSHLSRSKNNLSSIVCALLIAAGRRLSCVDLRGCQLGEAFYNRKRGNVRR